MGRNHKVRFEPVELEIDVDEDETVLDAAFRQGVSLMHGCREGQCSACKSFLLDGDVQMDRYSTFALAESESEEGYVLLCKTHVYSDCEVELINFDEDELRNAVPLQNLTTSVTAITALTADIVSLKLLPAGSARFQFKPGQYADLVIPGTPEHRSFSMAMTPDDGPELEFIIKRYPGGRFSALLESELKVGDKLDLAGPYGSFTIRDKSERPIVCVGRGAGLAPILSLLRHLAKTQNPRPVHFYFGARAAADLFYLAEISELGNQLADFTFIPCLSDGGAADGTNLGMAVEVGRVTDVLERREADLTGTDLYLCGPTPMVDAAMAFLDSQNVPREQVFFDKFTTTVPQD
ncbi:2Fe-2S iron-sulfur cluster binding domain-containing protein [Arthrobacter sp. zg-Y1219]|uniref:2Fe-2S iron-sulfur cluster binding domain-containing protein n=1 Tax=Arthrobacter sp. zg-Y1219 TaxID=3049067 RepID=UPI0024C2FDC6|nr:2Fe-2S iron-sulfur cluster binding domain-containing protein [Arthrobacter sp. zg-Y1219]MDK1360742.1 2Fe-2S iron-sulfur cluster binding domain-containing protein [Arthrobacter sp. zg-Y1219]